jgi:alkyl sulfatase BDS1-like metallo-beta-lactamase superfamily hydrolase
MNHVVFAEPNNKRARKLEADALEQLGYQAESGIWRNHYLTGAFELRNGVPPRPASGSSVDQLKAMTMDLYFDYLGILLNAPEADGKFIVLNWNITYPDKVEKYVLSLENSALTYMGPDKESSSADATVRMTRATLDKINTGELTWGDAVKPPDPQVVVEGNPVKLFELLGLLDTQYDPGFNIVTP